MRNRIALFGLLLAVMLISGCPFADRTYITAEDHYAVGWLLHNIDEETPANLDYSGEDFAVYNYSFNFPAYQPQYFGNILFWVPPIHINGSGLAGAFDIRLAVPLDRVYYVKGNKPDQKFYYTDWSFSNYIHLNYLQAEDPDSLEQFALDFSHEEHYLSEDAFRAIAPVPGKKEHIYFGKAPFTPASFIIDKNSYISGQNAVRLNGHLIRGYDNKSYIDRTEVSVIDLSTGEIVTIKLPAPKYQIYLNGELKKEGELTQWSYRGKTWDYRPLNYFISEDGNYKVKLTIPTNYPVWNNTIITAEFISPSEDLQPPELQHIEANPYFIAGEEYNIRVDLHDESGIEKVEIKVKGSEDEDETAIDLAAELADAEKSIYAASFTPPDNYEKIYLSISATDKNGNSVTYEILPIALPAQSVSLNLEAQEGIASRGHDIKIKGKCKIGNEICNNFLIHYYINNELLKADSTSDYDGSFELKWKVPLDYEADEINLTVKYDGTGIYLPQEKKISIPFKILNIDIGISDLKTSEPVAGEPVTVSAIVKNLGSSEAKNIEVEFSADSEKIETKSIPLIEGKKEEPIEFEWLPKWEDLYSLRLEAIFESDEYPSNNILEEDVLINYIAPDVYGFFEEAKGVIIGQESDIAFTVFNKGEKTAENMEANFYAFYKPAYTFFYFSEEESEEVIEVPSEEPAEEPKEAKSGKSEKDKEKPEDKPTEPSDPLPPPSGDSGGGGLEADPKKKISHSAIEYNGTVYNLVAVTDGDILVLNVSTEKYNRSLNFTAINKLQRVDGDIRILLDYSIESFAQLTIGNASLAKKNLDDLEPFDGQTEKIKWKSELAGEHLFLMFVNTTVDSNFENNYFGEHAKVLRKGTNIEARLIIDYQKTFVVGNETNITANITNLGHEDAKNIHLTLFEQRFEDEKSIYAPKVEKRVIASKDIDKLGPKDSMGQNFAWTPAKPGDNFLMLIAETKSDIDPEDNDALEFVEVSPAGSDLFPILYYPHQEIFANEKVSIVGRVYNVGQINSTPASASIYEISAKKSDKKNAEKKLIDKISIGVAEQDKSIELNFNWTPASSGDFLLELEVEAENDGNKDNNADSIGASVLSREYDVQPIIVSYPQYVLAGGKAYVDIILRDFGSKNAPEFNLTLTANGNYIDSAIVDLSKKGADFVSLSWMPSAEGAYRLKASINLTDSNALNNIDESEVNVFGSKDIQLSFIGKDGNFVDRLLVLGNQERKVEGTAAFTIPTVPLDVWIAEDGLTMVSLYKNSTIGNISINSSYVSNKVLQNGLSLYNIFANDDGWNYKSFEGILQRKPDTLDIRYTELRTFACNEYNFTSDNCDNWKEIPSETSVYSGQLYMTFDTTRAAAFAIGDYDYDSDNAPDWDDSDSDNDGIFDNDDSFTCLNGRLKSRELFNITINESEDTKKEIKGKNNVKINSKNKKILEFNADFDKEKLDCREILVEKQPEITTRGYTLVKGINLTNETKTAYVDKISGFKRVCIKDQEVESVDEVTQNCNGANELLVMCDGIKQGNYTCSEAGAQYKIEGLVHSAVVEPSSCQESWSCTSWSDCDGEQERSCTDTNLCGTNFNKPSEKRSCEEEEDQDEDDNDDRSGSLSRRTFDLGEIKDWSAGKSRELKLDERDIIMFRFDGKLNIIELEQVKDTEVSIRISWKSGIIKMSIGEVQNFDINKDGKDDISIKYKPDALKKVTFSLERIDSDSKEIDVRSRSDAARKSTDEKIEDKEMDSTLPSPISKEETGSFKVIAYSSLALLTVIILSLIIYNKEELFSSILRKPQKYRPQQSDYDRVRAFVTRQLGKGLTYEQISQELQSVGWKKELVDFVIMELRKGNKRQ